MKKTPVLLLLIAPYALTGSLLLCDKRIWGVSLALFAVILLFNAVYAFVVPRTGLPGERLLLWSMLLKLCNIPIFLSMLAVVLLTHILSLPLIPLLLLLGYSLLLTSSLYGISGLLCCYRQRELPLAMLVTNMIALLIFCVDVLSAVYCYIRVSKRRRLR